MREIRSVSLVFGLVSLGFYICCVINWTSHGIPFLESLNSFAWWVYAWAPLLVIGATCVFLGARNRRARQAIFCCDLVTMFGTRDVESRKHIVITMIMAVDNGLIPFEVMVATFRLNDEKQDKELQQAIAHEVNRLVMLCAWNEANMNVARRLMMEYSAYIHFRFNDA